MKGGLLGDGVSAAALWVVVMNVEGRSLDRNGTFITRRVGDDVG